MSESIKTESGALAKPTKSQKKKEELGYGNWLFRKKGTAAEPWPTAEELWNDPNVQKEMREVKEVFHRIRNQKMGHNINNYGSR